MEYKAKHQAPGGVGVGGDKARGLGHDWEGSAGGTSWVLVILILIFNELSCYSLLSTFKNKKDDSSNFSYVNTCMNGIILHAYGKPNKKTGLSDSN